MPPFLLGGTITDQVKSGTVVVSSNMWIGPAIRGNEPGHRQATWAELFFDLIFVVAVAQLATRLLDNASARGIGIYVLVYLPVWLSWLAATMYANRFDTDDLGQRLITFAQMLMVAGMAASVADATPVPFAISVALFRVLVAVSYARVRVSLPSGRSLANAAIGYMLFLAGIWFATAFVEGDARLMMWAFAVVFEILFAFIPWARKRVATVPLQMEHLPERFGLFTIIVLGETVLAVVIGVAHTHWSGASVVFALIGLTISFSLWWIYFESVDGGVLAHLGGFKPLAWIFGHAPMVIAITSLGVGIEVAVFTEPGEPLSRTFALILAGSLAVALLSIAILHAAEVTTGSWLPRFLRRLPLILVVLVVGFLSIPAQGMLVVLAVLAGSQAVIDVRRSNAA